MSSDNPEVKVYADHLEKVEKGNARGQPEIILENEEGMPEGEEKPEVAASIAELDSLIQRMG